MNKASKIFIGVVVIAVVAIAVWYFFMKKKAPKVVLGSKTILPDVPMQDNGSYQVKDMSNGLAADVRQYTSPGTPMIGIVLPISSTQPAGMPSTGTIHNAVNTGLVGPTNGDTGVLMPVGAPALNDNVLDPSKTATA